MEASTKKQSSLQSYCKIMLDCGHLGVFLRLTYGIFRCLQSILFLTQRKHNEITQKNSTLSVLHSPYLVWHSQAGQHEFPISGIPRYFQRLRWVMRC